MDLNEALNIIASEHALYSPENRDDYWRIERRAAMDLNEALNIIDSEQALYSPENRDDYWLAINLFRPLMEAAADIETDGLTPFVFPKDEGVD